MPNAETSPCSEVKVVRVKRLSQLSSETKCSSSPVRVQTENTVQNQYNKVTKFCVSVCLSVCLSACGGFV
ncbi:hypothetical protein THAOC_19752, partial [Thalassiosira oceanica]